MSRARTATFIIVGALVGLTIGTFAAMGYAWTQVYNNPYKPVNSMTLNSTTLFSVSLTDTLRVTIIEIIVFTVACMAVAYALTLPKIKSSCVGH